MKKSRIELHLNWAFYCYMINGQNNFYWCIRCECHFHPKWFPSYLLKFTYTGWSGRTRIRMDTSVDTLCMNLANYFERRMWIAYVCLNLQGSARTGMIFGRWNSHTREIMDLWTKLREFKLNRVNRSFWNTWRITNHVPFNVIPKRFKSNFRPKEPKKK